MALIAAGQTAPDFTLDSHLEEPVSLSDFRDDRNVLLVSYPLDFTPTWSKEIPGLDALLEEFDALDTQVLGLSVDSKYCHSAWAEGFEGIAFPLLADFHPKGEVARKYGLWLEEAGISDRATVLIGKDGTVLWSESVGPGGERNPKALLAKVKSLV